MRKLFNITVMISEDQTKDSQKTTTMKKEKKRKKNSRVTFCLSLKWEKCCAHLSFRYYNVKQE